MTLRFKNPIAFFPLMVDNDEHERGGGAVDATGWVGL